MSDNNKDDEILNKAVAMTNHIIDTIQAQAGESYIDEDDKSQLTYTTLGCLGAFFLFYAIHRCDVKMKDGIKDMQYLYNEIYKKAAEQAEQEDKNEGGENNE